MHGEQELHVIFGAGPTGRAVAQSLVARGVRVRLVSRSGARPQELPPAVEIVAADAVDPAQARSAAAGATVIYQCLGVAYHQWPEKFPPLQTAIVQAAEASGVRLVALENVYMYGEVDGPMTEELPYRATTRKGRLRAAMAAELMRAHERGRTAVAIGRASDFYGPGVTNSLVGAMLFQPLLQGKTAWAMGSPDLPHSYSYIPDVGHGLATLGLNPSAAGRIWHLPCAPVTTTREFIALAAQAAGVAMPKVAAMGAFTLQLVGLFSPTAREFVEMLYQFQRPFVLDDTRYRQAFGAFGPQATPLAQGLAETVRWYQAQTPGR